MKLMCVHFMCIFNKSQVNRSDIQQDSVLLISRSLNKLFLKSVLQYFKNNDKCF